MCVTVEFPTHRRSPVLPSLIALTSKVCTPPQDTFLSPPWPPEEPLLPVASLQPPPRRGGVGEEEGGRRHQQEERDSRHVCRQFKTVSSRPDEKRSARRLKKEANKPLIRSSTHRVDKTRLTYVDDLSENVDYAMRRINCREREGSISFVCYTVL